MHVTQDPKRTLATTTTFRLRPHALPFAVTPAFHKRCSTIETNTTTNIATSKMTNRHERHRDKVDASAYPKRRQRIIPSRT
jgi:hypothetical protein